MADKMNQKMKRPPMKKGVLKRILKLLFKTYPWQMALVCVCLVIVSFSSTIAGLFMSRFITIINKVLVTKETSSTDALNEISMLVLIMLSIYAVGWICNFVYTRIMAIVTQSFLDTLRRQMFDKMQGLPIRYFDTTAHGDIMSHYTNDVDTIRELISVTIPHLIQAILIVAFLIGNMIYLSAWMAIVVGFASIAMIFVAKTVGGRSAKGFIKMQRSVAATEGFVEEMMEGQKVVKVFCHEKQSIEDFDKVNEELCKNATNANRFANILMPIMGNIGNILYVFVAFVGAVLIINNVPNLAISALVDPQNMGIVGIAAVVPFLNASKQFSNNVSQVSQQINSIVMAMAGAGRVFELIDTNEEFDEGYVMLVNAKLGENGELVETEEHTGKWIWKHRHGDGTVTYTELKGDVTIDHMDFGYVPEKLVLKDITLYARPGQKVAFVGATGAGKTTITNLINRFYDIDDGKIRYDGININKIKKSDLRRSLGVVLQDVNLFTGTVMDNIRYGKLDATDEECIAAAKLANAHDFITRLPEGYNTMLTANGANLSQGQRQLISIARAAVADPPVMILDEATSSIDTRTEAIVQRGMDALMKGRTVFVIAHRLSTVRNSDVIMVLDHGEIIERGTHDELLSQKGKYYQLYTGAFELE